MSGGVVVRNVYHMMAYAFRALDLEGYQGLATESFDGVEDLMAAILTIGIDLQRKRGLERGYVTAREDVAGVRGRIDMRSTARLRASGACRATCEWGELDEDTYKNRVLKTVGGLLASCRHVDVTRRKALRASLVALRDVGTLDPRRVEWERLRFHRNNASYRMLMNVCRMVVDSMLLTEHGGGNRLARFSDSQRLHALYEHFVLEWFRTHHPELHASASVVRREEEDGLPDFLPRLVTDVTLRGPSSTLIIDCKCYGKILNTHHGKRIASPKHVNQIFSYVMHEAHVANRPVSGMLLYALTDQDSPMTEAWTDLGHDFRLWTLDLGQDFASIAGTLEEIALLAASGPPPARP